MRSEDFVQQLTTEEIANTLVVLGLILVCCFAL
jgi:hypothetical protein